MRAPRLQVDDLLTCTRSARKTLDLDAAVDIDEIRECLRIGVQAPSGSNQQSWRWITVVDSGLRRELGTIYQRAYYELQAGRRCDPPAHNDSVSDPLQSSASWLAEHISSVPLLVIPCYEWQPTHVDRIESLHRATRYGSIFPAVWNFQLALRSRGYGSCITTLHLTYEAAVRSIFNIPDHVVQGCLLPVARLRSHRPARPAARRPISEIIAVDSWNGPPL